MLLLLSQVQELIGNLDSLFSLDDSGQWSGESSTHNVTFHTVVEEYRYIKPRETSEIKGADSNISTFLGFSPSPAYNHKPSEQNVMRNPQPDLLDDPNRNFALWFQKETLASDRKTTWLKMQWNLLHP